MSERKRAEVDVKGVTERDFNVWKHHPVTKLFKEFLVDYRGALITRMVEQWESGALKLTDELEARGRVRAVQEMIDLEFGHVASMYGIEGTSNEGE
jgi:hypothetical protein